ncbi:hypothetical protein [Kribbella catacumbae]|uniref:hypothetical protein n=1 Tax=Kribbella catacumbae TaxID=460086 RepID=UPI000366F880|nr:hypothetical protein [Kribbella catacumbae]
MLSCYDIGCTPLRASQYDQRFSYCLYVPEDYEQQPDQVYSLAVVVHGTERDVQLYRDAFSGFAEDNDCIILAPLFPAGIPSPGDLDGYKYIEDGDLRYDELLLAMVDEVAAVYRVETGRFLLFGFSGGGHFAHRFLYLHPDRLLAASIGAPGAVTLLDDGLPWPAGIADTDEVFGRKVDPAALRAIPVQLVIGADDTCTDAIAADSAHPAWIQGVNDAGVPRTQRIDALRVCLEDHGVTVTHDIVPAARHHAPAVFPDVQAFFTAVLHRARQLGG